jgi:sulfatase modifying factor 1
MIGHMRRILTISLSMVFLVGCKKETATESTNDIPTPMVHVLGGTFQMGSTIGSSDETPVHLVIVSSFYMDTTEITYEKWTAVYTWGLTHGYTDLPAGENGSNPIGANNPVTFVNWYDVLKWCNARSEKDGFMPVYYTSSALDTVYRTGQLALAADSVKWTANGYRLPTEAEWEFAARGGMSSKGYNYSGSNNIDSVAWYLTNSGSNAHPVSTKGANELGLYDMSGNVWEWCWDWYGTYSASAQTDPKGSSSGTYRVLRGGSFLFSDYLCRVADRNQSSPNNRLSLVYGFRCVRN